MTRGNWQKRVERTEARRAAAKLTKERRRDRRRHGHGPPSSSSGARRRLEEWLDRAGDGTLLSEGGGATVDVWTDARPENRPEYAPLSEGGAESCDDVDDEDGRRGKGRTKGRPKERARRPTKKNRGKAHPNQKKKSQESEAVAGERSGSLSQNRSSNGERMCGQEFFFGRETGRGHQHPKPKHQPQRGGRKGRSDSWGGGGGDDDDGRGVRYYHRLPRPRRAPRGAPRTPPPLTLGQALHGKYPPLRRVRRGGDGDCAKPVASLPAKAREAALRASFDAAAGDGESCVDMAYHSRFAVDGEAPGGVGGNEADGEGGRERIDDEEGGGGGGDDDDDDDDETDDRDGEPKSRVRAALERTLERGKLTVASVVYLAVQGVLVYDRNRGGLVLSAAEERFLLFGDAIEDVVDPDEDLGNGDKVESTRVHEQLTHHLMDEILSYAEDEAAAVLQRVCSSWRDEVGTRSAQLWKTLLRRNSWPVAVHNEGYCDVIFADVSEECRWFRDAFVSHYSVIRDARALVNACRVIAGGDARTNNKPVEAEAAVQIFKSTNGAPDVPVKFRPVVKIWSGADKGSSPRALAAYDDFTLRLFEVDRGSGGLPGANAKLKCRQVVCVRVPPPSVSRKKDGCALMGMDLDDDYIACFIQEYGEEESGVPWMTVYSRDDVACAGNEGMLDDESVRSFDLRGAVLDFFQGGSEDSFRDELRGPFHDHLDRNDGDTSSIGIHVTQQLVACGKGHFLFHTSVRIHGYFELQVEGEDWDLDVGVSHPESCGHRLFLFDARKGAIVGSFPLERYREPTTLFASRPFQRDANGGTPSSLRTNVLVSGPTMALSLISVEIGRDRTIRVIKKISIESRVLRPWSKMNAALTSSYAVFSTDPVQGPVLHFKRIEPCDDEVNINVISWYHSIQLGGQNCKVWNIFVIREHYIAVVVTCNSNDGDGGLDGHWFGLDEGSLEVIIYHIPTRKEMFRSPMSSEAVSVDCVGDTLAANVSNLGFVIAGGNAREVAGTFAKEDVSQASSPPGKGPKGKKKRLASLASGRKKDGFARGMSLRG